MTRKAEQEVLTHIGSIGMMAQTSRAIGTWGCQCNFDIAARWDASQISALDGGAVTKIAFYLSGSGTADYRIRVWQGTDAATMLVDQAVPTVTL